MDDLISRQAAITLPIMPKEYRKHKPIDCDDAYEQGWSDCQSCIGRLPAAEPSTTLMNVEVGVDKESLRKAMEEAELTLLPTEKRGKWIQQDHNYKYGNVSTCLYFAPVCSECENTGDFKMNYCPNCGADMRGEQDENR